MCVRAQSSELRVLQTADLTILPDCAPRTVHLRDLSLRSSTVSRGGVSSLDLAGHSAKPSFEGDDNLHGSLLPVLLVVLLLGVLVLLLQQHPRRLALQRCFC